MNMRATPRYPLFIPALLVKRHADGSTDETPVSVSKDLSMTGLGVELQKAIPAKKGDEIEVALQVDEGESPIKIYIKTKIMWIHEKKLGLEIVEMSEEDRSLYQVLMEALRA